jgi:hypothetical protein
VVKSFQRGFLERENVDVEEYLCPSGPVLSNVRYPVTMRFAEEAGNAVGLVLVRDVDAVSFSKLDGICEVEVSETDVELQRSHRGSWG